METLPLEPQTQPPHRKAVVEIPSYDRAENYDSLLDRLNGLMEQAGNNVEFHIRQTNTLNLEDTIRSEASSGAFSSAYALGLIPSATLFDDEITMDVTALVQQNAPVYYSRYSSVLPDMLNGVPVSIFQRPLLIKPALMLREDFAPQTGGIDTFEGFFRYLDQEFGDRGGKGVIIAEPYYLVNEWALEQGYYNLDMFNIGGYLYAAVDDAACQPVLLESIPGFQDFLVRLCTYYKQGWLNQVDVTGVADIVGYVSSLHVYYYPHSYSPQNWMPWIKGKFTAHAFNSGLPSHQVGPNYNMVLAVPAACPSSEAVDVIRFVEWLYSGQENYDMVLYGKKGVDFEQQDGRMMPLVDGQATELTMGDSPAKFYFTWPGCNVVCNSDFYRVPFAAPDETEQLVNDIIARNSRLPLQTHIDSFVAGQMALPEAANVVRARRQQLYSHFFGDNSNALEMRTEEEIHSLIDSLSGCENDLLLRSYSDLIQHILSGNAEN